MDWKDLPLFSTPPQEPVEAPRAPAPEPKASPESKATPEPDSVLGALERVRRAAKRKAEPEAAPVPASEKDEGHEAEASAHERAWTVTELTSRIRGILEPSLSQIWVQGEVSNCRPAASGHLYFTLKDPENQISVVQFRSRYGARSGSPSFQIKDGMQVLCRGKISVYGSRGQYQVVADQIEPLGAGALQVAYEQLKARLAAEGLFSAERKRPLPAYPLRLAIVTSPTGAALQDMLTVLKRRAPHVSVVVVPALVQGEQAPAQILRGLQRANQEDLGDIIVLARGGGSIEDLWAFNDEALARAIAASPKPVVSAVGHEVDFTIGDFVADLRAPTPSAAAEIVTARWVDLGRQLTDTRHRLRQWVERKIQDQRRSLQLMTARLKSPKDRLRERSQRLDELFSRLERGISVALDQRRSKLIRYSAQLDALSPLRVLDRGYSIVRDSGQGGRVIRTAQDARASQRLEITFKDGAVQVRVAEAESSI